MTISGYFESSIEKRDPVRLQAPMVPLNTYQWRFNDESKKLDALDGVFAWAGDGNWLWRESGEGG
jgi:hypothetical protein